MNKLTLKKLAIATGVVAAIAAPASQASIVDHPFFRVLGVVIVWGDNTAGGNAPIASDFLLMTNSGAAGTDLIAGDVQAVVTGTLDAIPAVSTDGLLMGITDPASGGALTEDGSGFLDAADSLTAFGLDATTDVEVSSDSVTHSFYVASNTAFDIKAVTALNAASTGDLAGLGLAGIGYELDVTVSGGGGGGELAFGGNAQDPSTGGTSPLTAASTLASINNAYVFDGGQRTAASTGAIAGQSVRFDATYTLAGGAYDLSQGTGLLAADVTYTIFVP